MRTDVKYHDPAKLGSDSNFKLINSSEMNLRGVHASSVQFDTNISLRGVLQFMGCQMESRISLRIILIAERHALKLDYSKQFSIS